MLVEPLHIGVVTEFKVALGFGLTLTVTVELKFCEQTGLLAAGAFVVAILCNVMSVFVVNELVVIVGEPSPVPVVVLVVVPSKYVIVQG